MKRFFCSSQCVVGEKIVFEEKDQVHYLKDVLRLKPDEIVIAFDDKKYEYDCRIEEVSRRIVLKIKNKRKARDSEGIQITLACAIPKKAKFDEVVDKLTQLGVNKVIPMETARTEIKLSREKKEMRKLRWEKIAKSASQQSQRTCLPVIEAVKTFAQVLAGAKEYDLRLIPHLNGERKSLKDVFTRSQAKNILILIGPEGDFTGEEVKAALERGFIPVDLGERVLRVDTAALAAVSFLKLYAHG